MTVQTDSANVTVFLREDTAVVHVSELYHARKKDMGVTVLVPGLAVRIQGTYNGQNQLVANADKFNSKSCRQQPTFKPG